MRSFILLFLAFCLAALCACGPAPVETSPSPSITPSAVVSTPPLESPTPVPTEYSFSDIEKALRSTYERDEMAVVEVRDAGRYTIVQYTILGYPDYPERHTSFAWFDRESGTFSRPPIPQGIYPHFYLDEDSGQLTILDSGYDTVSDQGYCSPRLYLTWPDPNWPKQTMDCEYVPYYRPVQESGRLGPWHLEHLGITPEAQKLKQVCSGEQGMWLVIAPEGERPITDAFTWPRMEIENADGVAAVTLLDTTLDQGFLPPDDPRILSVEAEETSVTIRLNIEGAVRYFVGEAPEGEAEPEYDKKNAFPIFFHYVGEDYALDYPEGW